MQIPSRKLLILSLVLAIAAPLVARAAASLSDAEKEVSAAGKTWSTFVADKDLVWLREHSNDTKGILICSKVMDPPSSSVSGNAWRTASN